MVSCASGEVKDFELIKMAKRLAFFTVAYNIIEGLVSIYFGLEKESISLLGFGLDSFIEVASAFIVLLKLKSMNPENNLKHERRATFAIGVLFIILSLSVFGNSTYQLVNHGHPDTTIPGVIVSVLSLSFMLFLWRKKREIGIKMNSSTVMADAQCSLACIKLSAVLFIGSAVYWLVPALWWIDSVAAIVIGLFIIREGWELIENSRKEDF